MRKIISVVILAVYSIVMAHGFIPHHHHSEFEGAQHCQIDVADNRCDDNHDHEHDHDHSSKETGTCCVEHSHNQHPHNFCSFEEETILVKQISLSELFLPATEIDFTCLEKKIQSIADCYIPKEIPEPFCRDVQLRGPPHFS